MTTFGIPDINWVWEGLRELGWMEGKNLIVERRYADSIEGLQPLAEELVRANVDVIIAGGPNQTLAAMRATTKIPIVFRRSFDPVLAGLVASPARPGGNVTGFLANVAEFAAKNLTLLKELLPGIRRVGALETSGNPSYRLLRKGFDEVCGSLAIEPVYAEIASANEIDGVMAGLGQQGVQALILRPDRFMVGHATEIIGTALKYRLPTVADGGWFAVAGALASYAFISDETDRRVASFVDRILRGAKPPDLPVEEATTFWFVMNVKTARTLDINIPESILLRANHVVR